MKITDLNPGGGIGANCSLIEIGPFRILVDAGINPKKLGREAIPDFSLLDWDQSIDAIILTHAHLDHLGALPLASGHFPDAPILMSLPTMEVSSRMLRNSINVMKRQREEEGIAEYPLYTYRDLRMTEDQFCPTPFHHARYLSKGQESLKITLYPAGHVVGAASFRLEWQDQSIFHTGDILFTNQSTLPGATIPREKCNVLVMETTRGCNARGKHHTREIEVARLLEVIEKTIARGGSCLIPVFALGRTQEILNLLNEAFKNGLLPKTPVYAGGLGLALVDIFVKISKETKLVRFRKKVLDELGVKPIANPPIPGRNPREKGIYTLSSGMLVENTPSYTMAAALLRHSENTICFVGYCDPDTPGGQLLAHREGEPFLFNTLNYKSEVRADIERFDLSGHADREELVDFAHEMDPETIVLTHGDPEAREWFSQALPLRLPKTRVIDPAPLRAIPLIDSPTPSLNS